MTSSTFKELIDDAILIARYGQRCGRFKDNSLFAAIQKASANPDINWSSPEAAELQTALNNAAKLILPVTLIDLRNWDPYDTSDKARAARSARTTVIFVAVAIGALLLCGYFTSVYKNATALIAERPADKIAQQAAIINDTIYPLLGAEAKTLEDLRNPSSPLSTAVRGKMEQVRSMQQSIDVDMQSLFDLKLQLSPFQRVYYQIRSLIYPVPKMAEHYGGGSCAASENRNTQQITAVANSPDGTPFNELKGQLAVSSKFRCAIGLADTEAFPYSRYEISTLEQATDVLGLWILPAIYGALGSLMYYMRSILNALLPNPNIGNVLLRISLGGFSGIAVAWFWAPPLSRGIIVSDVTVGTLTIAFLVGFSIDIFFGLLDRLVTLATNSISTLGSS